MKTLRLFALAVICSGTLSAQQYETITVEMYLENAWENSSKTSFTYDGNGTRESLVMFTWDSSSGVWTDNLQVLNTNNSNGTVDNSIGQMWSGGSWSDYSKTTYSYTTSNLTETKTTQIYESGTWLNDSKHTFTYDSNDNNTVVLSKQWNMMSSSWDNSRQTNLTYNSDDLVTEELSKNWNDSTSTWDNGLRISKIYTTSGFMLESVSEKWLSGAWVNFRKIIMTYAMDDTALSSQSLDWDTTTSTWVVSSESSYTNNVDGLTEYIIRKVWDSTEQALIDFSKTSYSYTNPIGLDEILNPVVTIYPNPTSDVVFVDLKDAGSANLMISDMEGKVIYNQGADNFHSSIDIKDLPVGIYNLNITQNGKVYTKQLVKE